MGGLLSAFDASSFALGLSASVSDLGVVVLLKDLDIDPQSAPMPMRDRLGVSGALSAFAAKSESEPCARGVFSSIVGTDSSSSQTFSTTLVRTKAHKEQVVRSRVRHQPDVHNG